MQLTYCIRCGVHSQTLFLEEKLSHRHPTWWVRWVLCYSKNTTWCVVKLFTTSFYVLFQPGFKCCFKGIVYNLCRQTNCKTTLSLPCQIISKYNSHKSQTSCHELVILILVSIINGSFFLYIMSHEHKGKLALETFHQLLSKEEHLDHATFSQPEALTSAC